jgi:hypothetical protein
MKFWIRCIANLAVRGSDRLMTVLAQVYGVISELIVASDCSSA